MSSKWLISRRTMLKGLGAAIPLPLLDAMVPSRALAASAAASAPPPVRMAFIFSPNGMIMPAFTPRQTGADYQLPRTLEPLAAVKQHFNVLSGLALDNGRAKGDGPGDHARASASFLTGAHPYKTAGADIRLGVSVDQVAAEQIGDRTRLPSIQLGCDPGRQAGRCDSGYSCAYVSNISWRSETTPVPNEIDPAAVFDRLFGSDDVRLNAQTRARRLNDRKSILDFVAEDAQRLANKLGRDDQRKLDEFTTSVRDVEKRIEKARDEVTRPVEQPNYEKPAPGAPGDYDQHIRLMYDLMALSFQMDLTRISSFMVARAGSNRSFRPIGVSDGHHYLSHHRNKEDYIAKLEQIDRFYMQQFAYFINKLQSIPEGEGTLLDNCLVMHGSGLGDGNRHDHHDLPILLAGRGGGAVTPGRHLRYRHDTPLCNLFLSILNTAGVPAERFGDSTGRLTDLRA